MANDREGQAGRSPLLFISHRHAERDIAELLRNFVTDRSGGRIRVFQSSSAQADNTRVGRDLRRELMDHLWAAGAMVLIYTTEEDDWSYCMWECGVAMHPESPDTKVVVLQCGQKAPKVFEGARYAPILSRARSVPRQRCHRFDIYFSKFDTDQQGAVRIGFVGEPQAARLRSPQLVSGV